MVYKYDMAHLDERLGGKQMSKVVFTNIADDDDDLTDKDSNEHQLLFSESHFMILDHNLIMFMIKKLQRRRR